MNYVKKKNLAVRALKVGRQRIVFLKSRLDEIKDALSKQDIRDLKEDGAIVVKEVKGRRKNVKRKRKRGVGKVKKRVNTRKQDYVIMTRKLRGYVKELKNRGEISNEEVVEIRKRIRNKKYRSKAHLKEYIGGLRK